MIWGIMLEPGKTYTHTLGEEVQLSMAAIDSRRELQVESTCSSQFCQLVVQTENGEHVLCTLTHGVLFQQSLDLKLMPQEKVTFSAYGTSIIHLVGYTTSYPEQNFPRDSENYSEQEDRPAVDEFKRVKEEPLESSDIDIELTIKEETLLRGGLTDPQTEDPTHPAQIDPSNEQIEYSQPTDIGGLEASQLLQQVQNINMQTPDETSHPSGNSTLDQLSLIDADKASSSVEMQCRTNNQFSHFEASTSNAVTEQNCLAYAQTQSTSNGTTSAIDEGTRRSRSKLARTRQPTKTVQIGCSAGSTADKRCRQCSRTYTRLSKLRIHERSCKGGKRFVCEFCPKRFKSNRYLREHTRTHTGERPFKCRICPKTFARKDTLKDHEFTHSGVKPFACDRCSCAFVRKTRLVAHKRGHLRKDGPIA